LAIDHAGAHTTAGALWESHSPESHHRMAKERKPIHLLWRLS